MDKASLLTWLDRSCFAGLPFLADQNVDKPNADKPNAAKPNAEIRQCAPCSDQISNQITLLPCRTIVPPH